MLGMADQHQWVRLLADDFSATISASAILAHQGSHLANLLELNSSGELRLDCDAAVAREVVAVLRQGASYVRPTDARLMAAVSHQLDFLGIPLQRETAPAGEEVLWVPHYSLGDEPWNYAADGLGLLTYSQATRGWANMCGRQDPFTDCRVKVSPYEGVVTAEYHCMTTVLYAEATGAGEDVVFVVNNGHIEHDGDVSVCTRVGSLTTSPFQAPPQHQVMIAAAMTAAQGNLYLLGGHNCQDTIEADLPAPPCTVPMYVYRPQLNAWFSAASPLPDITGHPGSLNGHCLVANQQQSMLLVLGGRFGIGENSVRTDSIFAYDVTAETWARNPSDCRWHRVNSTSVHVSAVAINPYTVMVLSHDNTTQIDDRIQSVTSHVDMLDLRMWRWRVGAPLQVEVDATCHSSGRGLALYDNAVLAVGGTTVGGALSKQVHAYDPRTDSWREMPSLPFAICSAQPVVVRMTNPFPAA